MTKLEVVTHISLIAVSLASLGVLLERRLVTQSTGKPLGAQDGALVGRRLGTRGVPWVAAHTNAVLFINTRCRFCTESMQFYRRVEQTLRQKSGVSVSVLSAEPVDEVKGYLTSNGVSLERVYQVSLPDFPLHVTPTLLIVDSNGIIRRVFVGRLSKAQEADFLRSTDGPAS